MKRQYEKVTDSEGNTIGWVHQSMDETGWYSQNGTTRPKKNFVGFKHDTREKAIQSLQDRTRRFNDDVEVI